MRWYEFIRLRLLAEHSAGHLIAFSYSAYTATAASLSGVVRMGSGRRQWNECRQPLCGEYENWTRLPLIVDSDLLKNLMFIECC